MDKSAILLLAFTASILIVVSGTNNWPNSWYGSGNSADQQPPYMQRANPPRPTNVAGPSNTAWLDAIEEDRAKLKRLYATPLAPPPTPLPPTARGFDTPTVPPPATYQYVDCDHGPPPRLLNLGNLRPVGSFGTSGSQPADEPEGSMKAATRAAKRAAFYLKREEVENNPKATKYRKKDVGSRDETQV